MAYTRTSRCPTTPMGFRTFRVAAKTMPASQVLLNTTFEGPQVVIWGKYLGREFIPLFTDPIDKGSRGSAQDYRDNDSSWSRYARIYNPIKVGSIDGTDTEPHDAAVLRALRSHYTPCAPSSSPAGRAHCTLFVAGLNPRTTEERLAEECARAGGAVTSCRIVRDLVTGKSRRYAFVEFERRGGAERAHAALDGECVDNARLLVEWEARRALPGWRPRRLGGGFGGDKRSGQLRFGCRRRPFQRPIAPSAPTPPQPPKNRAEPRPERGAGERRGGEP